MHRHLSALPLVARAITMASMADITDLQRENLARHLRRHIAGEVRFDLASRQLYSTDASIYQIEPLGVVIPKTPADLVTVVQIAAEARAPLIARGGGTSLSGQSIGAGLVVDCSKYLNNILEMDAAHRVARVQPGVVLDQLNRAAAVHGLQFGPDVSTANRANLGGMIGNNSAGARSIVYGKTSDHVRRLKVLLADGSAVEFCPISPAEWDRRAEARTLEGTIYREVRRIIRANAEEIARRFPRLLRRVSGYNLDILCDALETQGTHAVGLEKLVIGGEGTLAVVAEAEIRLVPQPRVRGLLVPQFATLNAAMDALACCLEFQPSAVELMDHLLLKLASGNLALKNAMSVVRGDPQALLMVEFSGDEQEEVADRARKLQDRLREATGLTAVVPALDANLRDPLWNLRSAAMPLLYGMPGDRKPVTFVEDAAVAPARLPEFVTRFRDILRRHGTDGAFYGHASVGCLHIRPVLNLKDAGDVARMRRIAADVTDLVLEFHGSLSGEHGDGLARSEWNPKMFGPVVYEAFRQVKRAFDPYGILNPGKVVNAAPMTDQLRTPAGAAGHEPVTLFDYSRQEGFFRSIELCNGSGVCRKLQGGAMCPSFRATRDERDSTRGRANALRLALGMERAARSAKEAESRLVLPPPRDALRERWVYEVLDLCLMCKACKAECPSNVDMAKLKAEFLQAYYEGRPRPVGHWLMAHIFQLNRLGAWAAPILNRLQRAPFLRRLVEATTGIDRRRSLPPLHARHFRRWFAKRRARTVQGPTCKVLLLDDCFNTYNEPQIAQAAVRVLEEAGCTVELAGLVCCGRPLISKGYLSEAQALVHQQAPRLANRLRDGTPLLGLEPSCLLTLADEWRELHPGPETDRIAEAAALADGWLAAEVKAGRCTLPLQARRERCVLHPHCHQRALVGATGSADALRLIPDLEVTVLDAGCCGMAGSFGFEKEHYDLSMQIAKLGILPALAETPEATIIAPGTSCRHQIRDLAQRRALHPLEMLAGQLNQSPLTR
jgi:FAD/FMN-containing dehydrogenase/Fe-S oxidoreductase